jgi:hypothetical protein
VAGIRNDGLWVHLGEYLAVSISAD